MSNLEYNSGCLLFDMYLPAYTNFINLNFFILLRFFCRCKLVFLTIVNIDIK